MSVILASFSEQRLQLWSAPLKSDYTITTCQTLAQLEAQLQKQPDAIVLLDLPVIAQQQPEKSLTDLLHHYTSTRAVIFSEELDDELEWQLFQAGARGFCQYDLPAEQLEKVVHVIANGELWIRRALTIRLLDELANREQQKMQQQQQNNAQLASLTRREYQVACMIGEGANNKEIAARLDISERTVKAMLSEVYQKLDVPDRIQLGLFMTRLSHH